VLSVPIRDKDILNLSWNRLSWFYLGRIHPSPTLGQAGSPKPTRVRSSWFSSVFRVNPTRLASRTRPVHLSGSTQPGSVKFSPGSVQASSRPVQVPVHSVPDPVQLVSDPVQLVSDRFSCFRPGSVFFQAGSVCFRVQCPVQAILARFSSFPLGPGLFVPVFVHFTHFIDCVVVFLGFPIIVDTLCGRFDSA
jgi:hypothetical protein